MNDLDRMLAQRLAEVRDAHTSELGSELHARRAELFRRVRRRRLIRGAGALAGVTAVALAAVLIVPEVMERRASPPAGDEPGVHVETIEGVPGNSLVAAFGGSAMVSSDEQMFEIDREEGAGPPADIDREGCCDDLEWGEAGLYRTSSRVVGSEEQTSIEVIDPNSGSKGDSLTCEGCRGPLLLEVGDDEVWAFSSREVELQRWVLEGRYIRSTDPFVVQGLHRLMTPAGAVDDGERLWVVLTDPRPQPPDTAALLARVETNGNEPETSATIPLSGCPDDISASGGRVFVLDACDRLLLVADAENPRDMRSVRLPGGPTDLGVGLDYTWVTYETEGYVTRHDPVTGEQVGGPIDVGEGPVDIAAGDDAVWVANEGDGTVSRITLGATSPEPTETSTPTTPTPSPSPDQGPEVAPRVAGFGNLAGHHARRGRGDVSAGSGSCRGGLRRGDARLDRG